MPVYEYQCDKCKYELEEYKHLGDSPPDICPACNIGKLYQIISKTSFQMHSLHEKKGFIRPTGSDWEP